MRRKNYKGRCEKRKLSKCQEVVKTYEDIQYAYAELLEKNTLHVMKMKSWIKMRLKST